MSYMLKYLTGTHTVLWDSGIEISDQKFVLLLFCLTTLPFDLFLYRSYREGSWSSCCRSRSAAAQTARPDGR